MPQQFYRKILKYLRLLKPALKVGILILLVITVWNIFLPLYKFVQQNNFSQEFVASLIFNKKPPLKSYQGRTNVIILGIPGGIHDGTDLTDAIIFLSIDYKKQDVVEVSIPRDIWSDTLKDKINTAYHYGEEKKKDGGLVLAKAIIEEVVGQPVHYAWLLDFSGFKKLIDLVGGVDIFVVNSFTDNFYPITGKEDDFCAGDPTFACRYEKLQFEKGWEYMDGEQALKYVRSRQAEGEEGSDFARSRRQQQVIAVLKAKLLQPSFFWQNLKNVKELFTAFDEATNTDMKLSEQILFFKSFLKLPDQLIRHLALDSGDPEKGRKGLLVNPPLWQYNNEWVLVPRTGDFDEIHQYISCNLDNPSCTMKP